MTGPGPWRVETTPGFEREFGKLDSTIQRRIAAYLLDVAQLPDPRLRGKALTGNRRRHWRRPNAARRIRSRPVYPRPDEMVYSIGRIRTRPFA